MTCQQRVQFVILKFEARKKKIRETDLSGIMLLLSHQITVIWLVSEFSTLGLSTYLKQVGGRVGTGVCMSWNILQFNESYHKAEVPNIWTP